MQAAVILFVFALVAIGAVLVGPAIFRLFKPCAVSDIPVDWLDEFTPAAYYPMKSLLSDEDFRFLAGQPGFDRSLYRKLKRERLAIFRQYLRRLIVDFNRLHSVTRAIISLDPQADHSDLAAHLMRLKLKFTWSVIRAEFSYVLCRFGGRSIAVTTMMARFEDMGDEFFRVYRPQAA